MTRPLIAITGRRLDIGVVGNWLEPALASPTHYSEAVQRAGGIATVLLQEELDADRADDEIGRFDGLVLTGGPDVDPSLYGEEPWPETYGTDLPDDEFELALLHAALRAGTPVLAICKGHQLLNVAFGGSLDQHITGRPGLEQHGIPNGGGGALVMASVEADSRLAAALGSTTSQGMCHHHQAIARVGDGLRVVARAGDGIIEAVEPVDPGSWVVSVQWHPEDSAMRDPEQQRLFAAFVDAARAARA